MNIYIVAKYPTFILPIAEKLKEEHSVVVSQQFNSFDAQKADILFAEWLDENAIRIQNFPTKAKKILRIHRYEVYSDVIKYVDWKVWDEVIVVNRHIKDYLINRLGGMPIKASVIPNGIDIKKYTLSKADNNKIGFVGYWSRKKGIGLVEFLANSFPKYEFHLAGAFQELDVQEKLERNGNLYSHGWIKDKSEFFKDKKYVLNTALSESHGLSICEGMLCGCKPLIRNWISASGVYKPEWIYSDIKSFEKLLEGEYEPNRYRSFIASNYSFERQWKAMNRLIC